MRIEAVYVVAFCVVAVVVGFLAHDASGTRACYAALASGAKVECD